MREYGIYDTNRYKFFKVPVVQLIVLRGGGGGGRELPWHMRTKTFNKSMIMDEVF